MMMFGIEVLKLPFDSQEFWDLDVPVYLAAVEYHGAKVQHQLEELDQI